MNRLTVFFIMMTLVIAVVVYILYHVLRKPDRIVIYRENPPAMESSPAWGYRTHRWWRRYEGVPGMGKETPHPPTITPPQPGKYVPAFHIQNQ